MQMVTDRRSLARLLKHEIEQAADFAESELGTRRAESMRYYRGNKLGNEEDGRSQVVWRVVRDSVRQILPSLMRVFFSSERSVEYAPVGPEDVAAAEQATDYARYVVLQDNPGVHTFYEAFNDSLYQVVGIVKLWLDEAIEVTYHDFTGLDDAGVSVVLSEPGSELVSSTSQVADPNTAGQFLMLGVDPPLVHDITVKRTRRSPRIRFGAVPGEEFLIEPNARSIETAGYVGHKMFKTIGELVALGYDRDILERHATANPFDTPNSVERYRGRLSHDTINPDNRKVLYVESWLRVDLDGPPDDNGEPTGDGLAELRKFCTIGESYEIVNGDGLGEPVSDVPFCAFCPFPEPHVFYGEDVADQTKDLQRILSNLVRSTLDSLSLSIYPRTAVVEGMVNMQDALNTEIGGIVRQQAPGMVQSLVTPFVGKEALPIVELMMSEADRRVGVHNMALEADALQSTTKSAVNAQVDAARQQIELIARLYAEVGMKRFYTLLLKMIIANQDKARMIRLRNEWVEVDPRTWNANMDVVVNVGLGHGNVEERLAALREMIGFQREVLTTMGPNNPLVSLGQLSNTAAKLIELSGWKDTAQFISKLPADYQPPPPEPQPSEAEILRDIERMKAGARSLEAATKNETERDQMAIDAHLRAIELEAKYENLKVDMDALWASVETDRLQRGESTAGNHKQAWSRSLTVKGSPDVD